MKFVTQSSSGASVGSRVFLMSTDSAYQLFSIKNQELAFDVDVSNLPCGINGALYFTQMAADGGASQYPNNHAGAKYGTGYCAADCPRDTKFINGEVCDLLLKQFLVLTFSFLRRICLVGLPTPPIRIMEQGNTAAVARRWTFGNPTGNQQHTSPILAA